MFYVQPHEAVQRRLQVECAVEAMRLQHLFQSPVETLHHPVGLRMLGHCEPVLNPQRLVQRIELMLATGILLMPPKGPVGELPPAVGHQRLDLERRSLVQRVGGVTPTPSFCS